MRCPDCGLSTRYFGLALLAAHVSGVVLISLIMWG